MYYSRKNNLQEKGEEYYSFKQDKIKEYLSNLLPNNTIYACLEFGEIRIVIHNTENDNFASYIVTDGQLSVFSERYIAHLIYKNLGYEYKKVIQ